MINVAGHRLSTGAMEEVFATHPEVVECAVTGVADPRKVQVAALKEVVVVPALPKTRSGKILHKAMQGIAGGRDEPMPATEEDASVLDTVWTVLRGEPR